MLISGEKHEPARDIDSVAVDSLKALDPNRPIREADIEAGKTRMGIPRFSRLCYD